MSLPRFRPNPASRYPADPRAVFVLALCIFAGLPLMFGATKSQSLEEVLPLWAVALWGAGLTIGATITLVGMIKQTPAGVLAEQFGSVVVGVACIYYAGTAVVFTHSFPPGTAITLGWGLSCFWRWGQLRALVVSTLARIHSGRGISE